MSFSGFSLKTLNFQEFSDFTMVSPAGWKPIQADMHQLVVVTTMTPSTMSPIKSGWKPIPVIPITSRPKEDMPAVANIPKTKSTPVTS